MIDKVAHDFVDGIGKVYFGHLCDGIRYYYAEGGLYVVAYGNTKSGHTFEFVKARSVDELRKVVLENGKEKECEMKKKATKFIVRCDRAGVFYGEIESQSGTVVKMRNVRKVWYWDGACAVEELATNGTRFPDSCKITVAVDEMEVFNPVQIIPCTDKAVASLDAVEVWQHG